MASEWQIGFASAVITPDLGCQMAGFDARQGTATGVHDDLYARALVLDDGRAAVALVSLDLIGVSAEFAAPVRAEIARRTGIPAAHVILACTHTHCGPVTFNHFFNQGQPLDQPYLDRLAAAILAAVEQAAAARRPRQLLRGMVAADGIAVNRRTPDGRPVDPDAGVLLVRELDGAPVAVALSFACHTTVLGPNTLELTADFPYYTGRRFEQTLGIPALFFNGAEGDISIGHKSDLSAVGIIASFRTFEKAEELGTRLADAVLAGLDALTPVEPSLAVVARAVPLPLKSYAPLAEMTARKLAAAGAVASTTDPDALLRAKQTHLFSRIEEYYARLAEEAPGTLPAEVTVIRLGDLALVTFPGEVFVEIGLAIRARSPFPVTCFLGLANDYIGYVPTPSADARSGYEVVASRVTAEAAAVLADESAALLAEAFAR